MTDKDVQLILDRALADDEFRRRLESDLEGTVGTLGLNLSDEALAELMAALDEGGNFATGLDQRLSQSGISLNPAALLRQRTASGKRAPENEAASAGAMPITRRARKKQQASRLFDMQDAITVPLPNNPLEIDEIDIEVETD
jgi:hypothetical protein